MVGEYLFVGSTSDPVKSAVELVIHTISSGAFAANKEPVWAESLQEVCGHDIYSIQVLRVKGTKFVVGLANYNSGNATTATVTRTTIPSAALTTVSWSASAVVRAVCRLSIQSGNRLWPDRW